jgi:hypothetical protein
MNEPKDTEAAETGQTTNDQAVDPVAICSGWMIREHAMTWRKCPWEWGIDQYVTLRSSAGLLILCSVTEHMSGPTPEKIEIKPILASDLEDCPNATALPPKRSGGRQEQVVGGSDI